MRSIVTLIKTNDEKVCVLSFGSYSSTVLNSGLFCCCAVNVLEDQL